MEEVAALDKRIELMRQEEEYYRKNGLDSSRYEAGRLSALERRSALLQELESIGTKLSTPAPPTPAAVSTSASSLPSRSVSPVSRSTSPVPRVGRVVSSSLQNEPQSFTEAVVKHFPGSVSEEEFLEVTYDFLSQLGFNDTNTIPCVSLCRDEICRDFAIAIQKKWCAPGSAAGAFNMSSLAGMLFLGKTGLGAAHAHAPKQDGYERYVYFAMPHIAIDEHGHVGHCMRDGRQEVSHACGALLGFQSELQSGIIDTRLNPDDIEQSLIRQSLMSRIFYGTLPDLPEITKLTMNAILDTLERGIRLTVDSQQAHYAVLTGIQIHGPGHKDYIFPGVMYAQVDCQRYQINIPAGML
eukprot:CAMPEP_0196653518 /NCGR_PEP_ID=MMETSP1086-20130531/3161_1 /TAXON_ID=77921 /ORGANISM="Cyanoptyche  gloeocystis , Strain SAG4.97" /LENGTH=353 /DNA_ID=CAMNT_0041984769 /DNA_START=306 /DNA_END=1367 /DNA_ORIENTATION=+